jgi:serine-type D-Ala-D-Ala carboxypeptidase
MLAPLQSTSEPELGEIARVLVVEPGAAPGALLGLGARVDGAWRVGVGGAGWRSAADRRPLTETAVFDLASVTKPFVAAAAVRLARQRQISVEAELGSLLEEAEPTPSSRATLSLLLSHRAGLEAHRSLYAPLTAGLPFERRRALSEAATARRAECRGDPPGSGFSPFYSDLGYLLTGAALERALGAPLDALIEREVTLPLGLDVRSARQWLSRNAAFSTIAVPTEDVRWRGGSLLATVHDENSWAFAGHGVAGAAGLFGTAAAVVRFGCALLDALSGRARGWLDAESASWLVAERPGGTLRTGFDAKAGTGSLAGERCGPRTFGHLGFTGTSLWCDPDADAVLVALTNRVMPTRDNVRIRAARPQVNDAMMAVAERWRTLR